MTAPAGVPVAAVTEFLSAILTAIPQPSTGAGDAAWKLAGLRLRETAAYLLDGRVCERGLVLESSWLRQLDDPATSASLLRDAIPVAVTA